MSTPAVPGPRPVLDPAALEQLFTGARTAHRFTDEPVTDEQVAAIVELVKHPPTSMNTQPMRLLLVRSPAARERLATMMSGGNGDKTRAAPLSVVVAADRRFDEEMPRLLPHAPRAREVFADDALRERTAVFNTALQLGYLILSVRAVGLGAGPMTGIDAPAIEREFFPDGEHAVVAVVNVGVPDPAGFRPRGPRLAPEEVVRTV
ncbi:malonic semialdehyde reductase [Kineococcus auxinigenes]|uniref:malonic semialdehyde reductase n=1 Tax=unclassified Kineococcus TaxID=2621656 RepID=UPI003D7DDFBB